GHALVADDRVAAARDAEPDLRRVVPYRRRALAGQQDAERHLDAGGETTAGLNGIRMDDQRLPPPVLRRREAGEPLDLGVDEAPGHDDWVPVVGRLRSSGAGQVDEGVHGLLQRLGPARCGGAMGRPRPQARTHWITTVATLMSATPVPMALNTVVAGRASGRPPSATT